MHRVLPRQILPLWLRYHRQEVCSRVRQKFFDLDLNHTSTEDEIYDGKYYHFNGADGEPVLLADVQSVSRSGENLILRGELYGSEDEDYRPATFTARVKPYNYKGVNTWSLLSLESKFHEEM